MGTQQLSSFHIIGITVRINDPLTQAAQDIPALWDKFMQEGILAQIPHKSSNDVYCVYLNYAGDHTQPYTTLLGCRVDSLDDIPEGMEGHTIPGGKFELVAAKGNLMEGVVWNAWLNIWETGWNRTFAADFEVYGAKAQDPTSAEVEIFIGVQ